MARNDRLIWEWVSGTEDDHSLVSDLGNKVSSSVFCLFNWDGEGRERKGREGEHQSIVLFWTFKI